MTITDFNDIDAETGPQALLSSEDVIIEGEAIDQFRSAFPDAGVIPATATRLIGKRSHGKVIPADQFARIGFRDWFFEE